jgi:hypothetical protein
MAAKKYEKITLSMNDEREADRIRTAAFILQRAMVDILVDAFEDYVKRTPGLEKKILDAMKMHESVKKSGR